MKKWEREDTESKKVVDIVLPYLPSFVPMTEHGPAAQRCSYLFPRKINKQKIDIHLTQNLIENTQRYGWK